MQIDEITAKTFINGVIREECAIQKTVTQNSFDLICNNALERASEYNKNNKNQKIEPLMKNGEEH